MITYKPAKTEDAFLIRNLAENAWIPTYEPILSKEQLNFMFEKWYSINELKKLIQTNEQRFFIQLQNEIPVGFAAISAISEKDYKLNKIYIHPEKKGKGLGKDFILFIENLLKSIGAEFLQLNVNRYNNAYFFYLKMGFQVIKEEDIPIGNYFMNDYLMQKKLMV